MEYYEKGSLSLDFSSKWNYISTPASTKLKGIILVSPFPSVRPSVDRIVSALCLPQYYPIHSIFTHLINHLQKVCRVLSYLRICIFVNCFPLSLNALCPGLFCIAIMPYLKNRCFNWHGTKGIWIDTMLDPLYGLDLLPRPWPWPWIFKAKS